MGTKGLGKQQRRTSGFQPSNETTLPGAESFQKACESHQKGDLANAERHYRKALAVNPELIDGWRNLGALLRSQGRTQEGLQCTETALKQCPQDPSLWGNAGNALRDLKQYEAAKQAHTRAIKLSPTGDLGPLLGLAITLNQSADHWGVINLVLPRLGKGDVAGHNAADLLLEVGNAYHHLGRLNDAMQRWKEAAKHADGEKRLAMLLNMAQALCEKREFAAAEQLLEPEQHEHAASANLLYALAVAAKGQGKVQLACERFEGALAIDPKYPICLNTYGLLLRDMGRSHQARSCFEQALNIDKKFGAAMNNLGSVLKDVARYEEALKWLRKGAETLENNPAAQSNVLFTLVGYELEPAEQRYQEAKRFAEKFAKSPFERWRDRLPLPDPKRKLRVGLISPDFCRHAVSYFVEPLLENWNREQLEITLYACGEVRDDYTKRLQTKSERWRDLHGVSDENACLQILRDEIDILMDLAGHTAGNRMALMSMKPAPIQATYLGYYGTSGLEQIDYWVSDEVLHPPKYDLNDPCSETRWRLPRAYVSYRPLPEAPEVAKLPMLKKGFVTVGSFNQSRKITHTTAERWVAVLEAIPSAKLLLKSKNLGEPTEEARVRELFEELGLGRERLKLVGHSASVAEHLDYYKEIDIALDTYPYTGCTTTADALWMGVPVLTVAGSSMVSRQAAAVLAAAGYPEFICNSSEELVERCKQIIGNPNALAKQREEMREKVRNSDLLNAKSLSKSFEEAFQSWWQIWLQKECWAEKTAKPWPTINNRKPQPLLCKIGTSPHWSNQS